VSPAAPWGRESTAESCRRNAVANNPIRRTWELSRALIENRKPAWYQSRRSPQRVRTRGDDPVVIADLTLGSRHFAAVQGVVGTVHGIGGARC
jgi:hypothetical protein